MPESVARTEGQIQHKDGTAPNLTTNQQDTLVAFKLSREDVYLVVCLVGSDGCKTALRHILFYLCTQLCTHSDMFYKLYIL